MVAAKPKKIAVVNQAVKANMEHRAVIGLGFGDEGKGITTDYLCSNSRNPLVVRFSGGQQAGHTVLHNGVRHVFSNFGAGSLRGIPTYWSKYCTVDPIGLFNEMVILTEKGIIPQIFIDERCPVTTPLETAHYNQDHGTCGCGVGATYQREEDWYSLTIGDLMNPWVMETKLTLITDFYRSKCVTLYDKDKLCGALTLFNKFRNTAETIRESMNIKVVNGCPTRNLFSDQKYFTDCIYEGSQGLMLDQHYGFFPHVTRSNTGTKNVIELSQEMEKSFPYNLYIVTRAYLTRHGNGPMPNENLAHNIIVDPDETNVENKFQGKFRRALLDVSLLEYAISKDEWIRKSEHKTLVITCLDHIVNEYRFIYNGKIVFCDNENDFIDKVSGILNIKNILISKSPDSKNMIKYRESNGTKALVEKSKVTGKILWNKLYDE